MTLMDQSILLDLFAMFAVAIALIMAFTRLQIPIILAYVLTGLISGPDGLNWFNQEQIHTTAEIGVVLMMFSLGLEFSWNHLWAMRRQVFGLGSMQFSATLAVVWCASVFAGLTPMAAFIVGAAIALSSTAIVIQLLESQGWLGQARGQVSIAILLFQDLAVVPILIILSLLSSFEQLSGVYILSTAASATLGVMMFMLLGRIVLPKLFDEVALVKKHEVFVLTTLVVALLTGMLTKALGLSMALGALMAGMLLGESQYKHQIKADIRPFKDIFLGLFFISVGMMLELAVFWEHGWTILFVLVAVILIKLLIVLLLMKWTQKTWTQSFCVALCLAQVGELSFVVMGVAMDGQLLPEAMGQILIAVAVVSIALSVYAVPQAERWLVFLAGRQAVPEDTPCIPAVPKNEQPVILLGYGRVGQTIGRFLKMERLTFRALDLDPIRVKEAQSAGESVYFGHACHRAVLKKIGVQQARLVVITFNEVQVIPQILDVIKRLAPEIHVIVRTHDDSDMEALIQAGADQVIPEMLEGSLMLVSQVLFQSQVPLKKIMRQLATERQLHYKDLHHFFVSEENPMQHEGMNRLHAVQLIEDSYVVGLELHEVCFKQWKIEIQAIRRCGQETLHPPHNWTLEGGDVLLLIGSSHSLELAEAYIHIG
jgi:CPA2 family monovalent cation:H+ antiporter-2